MVQETAVLKDQSLAQDKVIASGPAKFQSSKYCKSKQPTNLCRQGFLSEVSVPSQVRLSPQDGNEVEAPFVFMWENFKDPRREITCSLIHGNTQSTCF